jgi:hypothetical protein
MSVGFACHTGTFGDSTPANSEDQRADRICAPYARWLAERTDQDYETAFAAARRALEEFKSSHDREGEPAPIPLLRLGVDETGSGRVVNTSAKRLVGFSDDEIAALVATAKETIDDASI